MCCKTFAKLQVFMFLRCGTYFLLTAFTACVLLYRPVYGQVSWQKYAGNPVLLPDLHLGVFAFSDPSVIFDGATYRLWISGGGVVPGDTLVGVRTYYYTSQGGFSWLPHANNPVFRENVGGSWDSGHIETPSVLMVGDQYWLYYTATIDSLANDASFLRLGLATSADGANWTRHPENPLLERGAQGSWEERWIESPSVLKTDSLFYLWYNGVSYDWSVHVGLATSADGIHWQKHPDNPVFSPVPGSSWDSVAVYAPQVHKLGDRFLMIYTGLVFGATTYDFQHSRNGIAVSEDGIHWQRVQDQPAFAGTPGAWDSTGAFTLDWALAGDKMMMFYVSDGKVGVASSDINNVFVESKKSLAPAGFSLMQNYPNPFNSSTVIPYSISSAGNVTLSVFDLNGREIRTLVERSHSRGSFETRFDAGDLPSGIYICRLSSGKFSATKKITILR